MYKKLFMNCYPKSKKLKLKKQQTKNKQYNNNQEIPKKSRR